MACLLTNGWHANLGAIGLFIKKRIFPLFASVLLLSACVGNDSSIEAATPDIYVVDVERVMQTSRAAELGRTHLEEARKGLVKGYNELEDAWKNQPETERKRVAAEGIQTLNRQMTIEQQAITKIVTELMLKQIQAWRTARNAALILAKQNILDAADNLDITKEIIDAMNKEDPEFPSLPIVSIKKPDSSATKKSLPKAQVAPKDDQNKKSNNKNRKK